jgi:hypothetical protein
LNGCDPTNRTGSSDCLRNIATGCVAAGHPTGSDAKSNTSLAKIRLRDGLLAKVKDTRLAKAHATEENMECEGLVQASSSKQRKLLDPCIRVDIRFLLALEIWLRYL